MADFYDLTGIPLRVLCKEVFKRIKKTQKRKNNKQEMGNGRVQQFRIFTKVGN